MVAASESAELRSSGMTGKKRHQLKILTYRALVAFLIVLGWEYVGQRGIVDPFFISYPSEIWARLVEWHQAGELWRHASSTIAIAMSGWIISAIVGTILGFAMAAWRTADEVSAPFIDALNAMPRIALGPLFILWLGIGYMSKIVLIFSVNVIIHMISANSAAKSVDSDLMTLSRVMGASPTQLALKVILPWSIPFLFVGLRLGLAYALAGAILGEILASRVGLGNLIARSAGILDTAGVLAALGVVVIIAFAMNWALAFTESRLLRWRPQSALGAART